MKLILAVLAVSLALLHRTDAAVVIYKGTERQKQTFSQTPLFRGATLMGYYLFIDFDAKRVAQVLTFTSGGKKYYTFYAPSVMRFAQPPLAGGKSATVIAHGGANDNGADEFEFNCFYLLGTNQSLTIKKGTPAEQVIAPRVFTGSFPIIAAAANSSRVVLRSMLASFQSAATLKANGSGKTLDETFQEFVDDLDAKGFIFGL